MKPLIHLPRLVGLVLCLATLAGGCTASSPPDTAIPPVIDSRLIGDLVGERSDAGGSGDDSSVMRFAWSDGRWVHAQLSYTDEELDEFVNPPADVDLSMGDTREVAVDGGEPLLLAERPPLLVNQTIDCIRLVVASWHFGPVDGQVESRFVTDVEEELARWRAGLETDPCEGRPDTPLARFG